MLHAELAARKNTRKKSKKRKRKRRRKRRRKRKRKRKRKKRRKRKRKRRGRRRRKRRRRRRKIERRKPKTTSSETVICVKGSQTLHIKTEKVRRGGRRGRRRRKRRKRKRRKKGKKRGKRKKQTKGKKNAKGKQGKTRRFKRYIDVNRLHLPKPTLLKIYSGVEENEKLSATYFVTDRKVNENFSIAKEANPSTRELQSVVEAIDSGFQDEVSTSMQSGHHKIGKRSASSAKRGVRCYRVLNFGREEKGEWQRMIGSRRLMHRGKLSASVIEDADVRMGAMLRASKRPSGERSPTIVLGRDGRTLRCTPEMMHRSDTVGARCRAVMRCEHGGRWKRVGRRGYRCRCPFGYGGPRCAHRAIRCPPGRSRCRNGGTCLEMPPSRRLRGRRRPPPFRCFCPHHFTGRLCQRRRRSARIRCSSRPCLGGGRCRDLSKGDGYLCICPRGRSGHRCQHSYTDVCQPDGRGPCRHDGRCLSTGGGSYFCLCNRNHGGRHCQLPVGGVTGCPRSFCHHRGRHTIK